MRFPLTLTLRIAAHLAIQKLKRREKFATVLQLEPIHTCNLTCTGCGRIREYSTSIKDLMPLEDCLAAARECDAPMVSLCGGEPLLYPKIEELVAGLLHDKRIVYLCTNGLGMRKKMREAMASTWAELTKKTGEAGAARKRGRIRLFLSRLETLKKDGLLSEEQARAILAGEASVLRSRIAIQPHGWLYWNVHLDGLRTTHDKIVEREGVFDECIRAIRMAKVLGYRVATNTTVYKETDMAEIESLFQLLAEMGIDGHTISPGYDYDAAKADMVTRLGLNPAEFFLTPAETRKKFAHAPRLGREFPILGTAVYLDFLAGLRELSCSAWAIPTRNIRGWKGPCYLKTDGHYATYAEMLARTDWTKLGRPGGKAADPRCENCMVHCGFEPSAMLGVGAKPGDLWRNLVFNFAPRPRWKHSRRARPQQHRLASPSPSPRVVLTEEDFVATNR